MKKLIMSLVCVALLALLIAAQPASGQTSGSEGGTPTATPTGTSTTDLTATATPTSTATPTATAVSTPTPLPPPRISVRYVEIMRLGCASGCQTQKFFYSQMTRFVVTYHTVNSGKNHPVATLRILLGGGPIRTIHMQPTLRSGGFRAFQAYVRPQGNLFVGNLVAQFSLSLGPAHATRSIGFRVVDDRPPHGPPLLSVGGSQCNLRFSVITCRVSGTRFYPDERVYLWYTLSLDTVNESPRITCLTRPGCRQAVTDDYGRFGPVTIRFGAAGWFQLRFDITAEGTHREVGSTGFGSVRAR